MLKQSMAAGATIILVGTTAAPAMSLVGGAPLEQPSPAVAPAQIWTPSTASTTLIESTPSVAVQPLGPPAGIPAAHTAH